MNEAAQTPIQDLLRRVPRDHRIEIKKSENCHHLIPIGRHAHEAADKIDELQTQIAKLKKEKEQLDWMVDGDIRDHVQLADKLKSEHSTEMARVLTEAYLKTVSKQMATDRLQAEFFLKQLKLQKKFRWDVTNFEPMQQKVEPERVATYGGPPEKLKERWDDMAEAVREASDENKAWDELENILPKSTNQPVMLKDLIAALRSIKAHNGIRGPGHFEFVKYGDLADALEKIV